MQKRTVKRHTPWKYVNDRTLRGAMGETDYGKKLIRVNKPLHRKVKKSKKGLYRISKKDSTLINTLVHETLHAKHPRMHERTVRKLTSTKVARMGKVAKKRMYNKVK